MAYTYGLVGIASVSSAGAVDGSNGLRIFDLAFASTSNAVAAIQLNDLNKDGTIGVARVLMPITQFAFNSNAGLKFPNGCYCVATGCTATINYIREF